MENPPVYLSGQLTSLNDAKISVLDRGFIFSDGVYEVLPIYHRQPFRGEQHLARLFRSMLATQLSNPHDKEEWMALIGKNNPAPEWFSHRGRIVERMDRAARPLDGPAQGSPHSGRHTLWADGRIVRCLRHLAGDAQHSAPRYSAPMKSC